MLHDHQTLIFFFNKSKHFNITFELFSSVRCNANHYKPYNSFKANITFIEFCTDWQFASKG